MLVGKLGGDALLDLVSGKKTWHGLVYGVAMGVAQWAAETRTNPIRKERDAALTMLEEVKRSLEPKRLPLAGSKDKTCQSCGVLLFASGIGVEHRPECIYEKICLVLEAKRT